MTDMGAEDTAKLSAIPEGACEPVRAAIQILHDDIEQLGGPSIDHDTCSGIDTLAANAMARYCTELCAAGCIKDLHDRATDEGSVIPSSSEKDLLFELVSATLANEILNEPNKEHKVSTDVEIKTTGDELKRIVESRLAVFNNPELIERLAANVGCSVDEIVREIEKNITPIDDDFYSHLIALTNGNIQSSMTLIAYFQQVFPLFRSSRPKAIQQAGEIADLGFTPANPWTISALDLSTIEGLADKNNTVNLYDAPYSTVSIRITGDPYIRQRFKRTPGIIVDIHSKDLTDPL